MCASFYRHCVCVFACVLVAVAYRVQSPRLAGDGLCARELSVSLSYNILFPRTLLVTAWAPLFRRYWAENVGTFDCDRGPVRSGGV